MAGRLGSSTCAPLGVTQCVVIDSSITRFVSFEVSTSFATVARARISCALKSVLKVSERAERMAGARGQHLPLQGLPAQGQQDLLLAGGPA